MTAHTADRTSLRRTIAVVNGKGGVGKTSITANLAGLFAAAGYRVLVFDLDPQGNLGNDLGYLGANLSDAGLSLATAAVHGSVPTPISNVREQLDVVAGGEHLHDLAGLLQIRRVNQRGGVETLVKSIAALAGQYDLTLLDCPPGNELLQAGALAAARWVLIPTKTDDASRAGLREVARRFIQAREQNPELALLGVVLFGVNLTARRILRQAQEALAADLSESAGNILTATIRHVEAAAFDARSRGQLAHELEREVDAAGPWYTRLRTHGQEQSDAPRLATSASSLAGDYQRLAEEILDRVLAAEAAAAAAPVVTP